MTGAGDPRLQDLRFRQVLIDESTQAMEAEWFVLNIVDSLKVYSNSSIILV